MDGWMDVYEHDVVSCPAIVWRDSAAANYYDGILMAACVRATYIHPPDLLTYLSSEMRTRRGKPNPPTRLITTCLLPNKSCRVVLRPAIADSVPEHTSSTKSPERRRTPNTHIIPIERLRVTSCRRLVGDSSSFLDQHKYIPLFQLLRINR
jgi:hypothetical protein